MMRTKPSDAGSILSVIPSGAEESPIIQQDRYEVSLYADRRSAPNQSFAISKSSKQEKQSAGTEKSADAGRNEKNP